MTNPVTRARSTQPGTCGNVLLVLPYVKSSVVRRLIGKPETTFYKMLEVGEIPDEVVRIKRGAHTEWCVESVWYWLHHRQDPTGADDIDTLLAWVDAHPLPEWVVEIASRHTLVSRPTRNSPRGDAP